MTTTTTTQPATDPTPPDPQVHQHDPAPDPAPDDAAAAVVEDQEQDDEQGAEARPEREAAKYRRQLRERETELESTRDELQASQALLVAARQSIAEELSGLTGRSRDLLWEVASIGDVFDEGGRLDRARLDAAVKEVTTTYGLRRGPAPDPSQGRVTGSSAGPSWSGLVQGR